MGQAAQKKMKNKKKTKESTSNNNSTTKEDVKNETKQSIKIQNSHSSSESNLKTSKSESREGRNNITACPENQCLQKSKNANKTVVVTPEELGIHYTENLILKQGVKREELLQEKFGMQQLSVMATMGDAEKTRAFFDAHVKRDPNERVECDGSTPLILAADNKHVETVKVLLEHGADVTLTNKEGNNALMTAIKSGDADVINAIWPHRSYLNLDHANKNGFTALHFAAERKWECCVQFLVANGASPNCKTVSGETPLMMAARLGDKKTTETLVLVKADILAEDNRGRTAICIAFLGSKKGVLAYLLEKLPVEKTETFIKSRLYYLRHPFMEDYREFCDVYLYRLLLRLTWKSTFRDAFYNQKVIVVVLDRMKEIQHYPQDMVQLSSLLCSIMFMFNKKVDVKLIKQYIYSGGPDFTIDTVRYYTEKLNIQERDTIIYYLPMIGITEVPEGVAWLRKNYLRVSEYSNFYKGNLAENLRYALADTLTEIDPEFTKVMGPVWEKFHKLLFDIQQKQREKTMMELLQEEEREKERRVKKREKRQHKRQVEKDKRAQKQDEVITCQQNSSSVDEASGSIDISQNSNDNENESASRSEVKTRNRNKTKYQNELKNEVKGIFGGTRHVSINHDFITEQMIAFSSQSDRWQTVQTKKHSNKDKEKVKDRQETVDVERKDQLKCKKSQHKVIKKAQEKNKLQRERTCTQPVRWADVAKGVTAAKTPENNEKHEDTNTGFSYDDEFPTLDGTNGQAKSDETNEVTQDSANLYNSINNTPEEDLKGGLTNISESSRNPSSPSGISLNSFSCEAEAAFVDEKYYSDDDVQKNATYTEQSLSADETHIGWEDIASMNEMRCATSTFPVSGQKTTIQMNSETLQYLVDAYISSDGGPSCETEHQQDKELQGADVKIEEKLNIHDPISSSPGQIYYVEPECVPDKKEAEVNLTTTYDDKTAERHSYTTINDGHKSHHNIPFDIQNARTELNINAGKYARDPSPSKAPRKRFTPPKNKPLVSSKHERVLLDRKLDVHDKTHTIDTYTGLPDSEGISYDNNTCFSFENDIANRTRVSRTEVDGKEAVTTHCDDCPEILPSWYTNTEPPKQLSNLSDLNDKETEALVNCSGPFSGPMNSFSHQDHSVIPATPGFMTNDSAPKDDIADDPCIVQYWTQPKTFNIDTPYKGPLQTRGDVEGSHQGSHHSYDKNRIISADCNSGYGPQIKDTCYHYKNESEFSPYGAAPLQTAKDRNQAQKQTAVVKPISKQWKHARHSVNSVLGQSILENACRIDTTPDEVLYPSDLRGSPEHRETEDDESDYFPSFHEDTRLSAHYQRDAISVFHKLQQMQLAQLKIYYDAVREQLLNKMAVYQTDFHYYASCTGLTHQQLNEHLGINEEQHLDGHGYVQQHQETTTNICAADHADENHDFKTEYLRQMEEQRQAAEQVDSSSIISFMSAEHNVPFDNTVIGVTETNSKNIQRSATVKPIQPHRYMTNGNPDNTQAEKNITVTRDQKVLEEKLRQEEMAARAAREMADRALQDIKAAYNAMVANSIKSRRWREKLLDIRHMPPADINIVGNIVFPKVNQARFVIRSRPETIMLGFLLNGTPVAVRIINWRSRHLIRDDLQRLVDLDVSKYFMTKYRDFSFLNGNYYIAMDLYEYTLDEYLYKLKTDGQDTSLCTNKLIWQFLRGLNGIHQHCLMIHGEIRPSNIVIDLSGNLRITGYGLGRRANCDSVSSEFSAEERCWVAPEILLQEQGDTFKADIWSAGMIMYFILSGGKQPLGADPRDIVWNLNKKQLKLESLSEEAFHLLSIMLSLNKTERPATSEALRHPYFWAEEKRLRFVLIAGSDVLRDLKAGIPMSGGPGDSMIDILNSASSASFSDWISEIDQAVMKEMRAFRQYKNTVVELVLFVYNCCLHFEKMSTKAREIIDEPCKYFLSRFPTLFMTVYKAIKTSSRTEKTCYKPFF